LQRFFGSTNANVQASFSPAAHRPDDDVLFEAEVPVVVLDVVAVVVVIVVCCRGFG